ncbi:SDR family NAD(P)-dependent oxidoreductase [Pseudonocardia sp. RS11V-5]|uniref:SDR family NAD(P)-dependent oxidoreductase n=1 Tax=Pseudonocardia terrae TaxID=2905831 RepID=UPI001E49FC2B|nr:SDR family NAD(P)-dependent oxidoreductase [Pseudonocardia terrae]MCE3553380.1 SDR family NAD(P)-dependent oxidoreductase [Pseudonocardia terrae]
MRVSGRVALVTGASSGIGTAVAQRLAGDGARLVLTGRDPERLQQVAERTGAKAVVADLAAGVDTLLDALPARPALVVHCAGVGAAGPLEELSPARVDELIDLNLRAPVQLTRALLPGLRAERGHLVFVASIAALGVAGEAVYSATKAGLRGFADAVRIEAPEVGVTTVLPGAVDTPYFGRRGREYDRRFPRPIRADRVAEEIAHGIRRGSVEIVVPRWLALGAKVHGAAPALFARASRRFG